MKKEEIFVGFDDGDAVVVTGVYPVTDAREAAEHYLALPRNRHPFSRVTTRKRLAQLILPRIRLDQWYGLPFFMEDGTPVCDWRILPPPRRTVVFA